MGLASTIWMRNVRSRPLDEIEPAVLREVLATWRAAAGDDVPQARDLPVGALKFALGDMALVSVRARPFLARYLVVGPTLVRLLGRDPKGQLLSTMYPAAIYEEIKLAFEAVIATRAPSFYTNEYVIVGRRFGYHRLILPLADINGTINRLVVAIRTASPGLTDAWQWLKAVRQAESHDSLADEWRASVGAPEATNVWLL